MTFIERLVYLRGAKGLRRLVREVLALYGVEVPPQAMIGPRLNVKHRGFGLVVSGRVTIGSDVTLYQGVTLGQSDPWKAPTFDRIVVQDRAILGAGCKVLATTGKLTIHEGCVIGANAVLTTSTTGPNEVWAGAPARLVRVLRS